jgi:hypothetical protein
MAENLFKNERRHVCSAYFTFVQVKQARANGSGADISPIFISSQSVKFPLAPAPRQVVPTTPEDLRRHVEALERREMRIRSAQEREEGGKEVETKMSDLNQEDGELKAKSQSEAMTNNIRLIMPNESETSLLPNLFIVRTI